MAKKKINPELSAALRQIGDLIAQNKRLKKELNAAEKQGAKIIAGLKEQVVVLEKRLAEEVALNTAIVDAVDRVRRRL